jgi:hypothetical protein
MSIMNNPYEPPESGSASSNATQVDQPPSKPIIPAVIGMFTYGSSSPYALVLCAEHYLGPNLRSTPWSTHLATLLATFGSFVWFTMGIRFLPLTLALITGNPTSTYASIGLTIWIATAVFFVWAIWRLVRLRRQLSSHGRT